PPAPAAWPPPRRRDRRPAAPRRRLRRRWAGCRGSACRAPGRGRTRRRDCGSRARRRRFRPPARPRTPWRTGAARGGGPPVRGSRLRRRRGPRPAVCHHETRAILGRRSAVSPPLPSSVATEPWIPPTPSLVETAAGAAAGAWAAVGAPVLVWLVRLGLSPLGVSRHGGLPPRNGEGAEADGDPGWFGPDSVTWRVHADTSMLVAGMTAFALQALHPRAMAGVWDHSAFGGDFFGRTRRTG